MPTYVYFLTAKTLSESMSKPRVYTTNPSVICMSSLLSSLLVTLLPSVLTSYPLFATIYYDSSETLWDGYAAISPCFTVLKNERDAEGNLVTHDDDVVHHHHTTAATTTRDLTSGSSTTPVDHLIYADLDYMPEYWRINNEAHFCFVREGDYAISNDTIDVMRQAFAQAEREVRPRGIDFGSG